MSLPQHHAAAPAPSLHADRVGSGPGRVVFLHGLFGRGRNFIGIAKKLGERHTSLLVDLPNHGRSAWTCSTAYPDLADEVAEFLRADFAADGPVDVVGHSMGGKVAMALALRHPDLVRRLVVVDISPAVASTARGNFEHLLGSLDRLDLDALSDRAEADRQLREPIPEDQVRAFLLQNLRREGQGFRWQANLQLSRRELPTIMDWPDQQGRTFTGPVLWIAGGDSDYVREEDLPVMRRLFPKVRRLSIRGAGHWVHADRPEEMVYALSRFLEGEDRG